MSAKKSTTISGKRILVTGGAGSIGSELVRQLAPKNAVYIVDLDETGYFDLCEELQHKGYNVHGRVGDVCDRETIHDVFSDFKPEIVFHAAARKHVKPMEEQPMEAIKANCIGTYNLLDFSKRYEVKKFVFISTDKVVHSRSIMGATKRVGEIMTLNYGYTAVRFGNVLGSRGSVIPFWQEQINRGDPITVTDPKMERFFMTIPQACSLVIKAATKGKGGETYILDMGRPVNIMDLAKRILADSGSSVPIKVIGIRPGEKLFEELMTAEEKANATKEGEFYVLR